MAAKGRTSHNDGHLGSSRTPNTGQTFTGIQIIYAEDLLLEQFIAGLMAYDNWNDTETFTDGTTDYKRYCNDTINVKTSHLANSTTTRGAFERVRSSNMFEHCSKNWGSNPFENFQ